jgi:hypothetical protein
MEQNDKPSIVIVICHKVISANIEVIIVTCINANAEKKLVKVNIKDFI